MQAQKQYDIKQQRSQVQVKTVSGLKCPDCRQNTVSVKIVRGDIIAGSAKCSTCAFFIQVAKFSDGIVAKCPCCGRFAFPALGYRVGHQPFVALTCDLCNWLASERYMQVVRVLLGVNNSRGVEQNDQKRESDKCLDGVPSPFEAALQAFHRGDQPICPFCGEHYRDLEAIGYNFGEVIYVTLWRCRCGVFPVKAEAVKD